MMSSLGFAFKKPCVTADGRISVQNSAAKTSVCADQLGKFTGKFIRSAEMFGNTLVAIVFTLERRIFASRIGVPHILGGRLFLNVRSMKPLSNMHIC